jgi:hypothetical protein
MQHMDHTSSFSHHTHHASRRLARAAAVHRILRYYSGYWHAFSDRSLSEKKPSRTGLSDSIAVSSLWHHMHRASHGPYVELLAPHAPYMGLTSPTASCQRSHPSCSSPSTS